MIFYYCIINNKKILGIAGDSRYLLGKFIGKSNRIVVDLIIYYLNN